MRRSGDVLVEVGGGGKLQERRCRPARSRRPLSDPSSFHRERRHVIRWVWNGKWFSSCTSHVTHHERCNSLLD